LFINANQLNFFLPCSIHKFLLSGFAFFLFLQLPAQTVLLNPNAAGGFENGTTFAANGWTQVASTNPNWYAGNAAVPFAGAREAHIGTSATNFSGTTTAPGARHFYRDIAIPAAATNIFLSFYLKLPLEDAGYDFLNVYSTTTANTPVNGTVPGAGYTQVFSYTSPALATYWGMQGVQLSNALAGTTVRLVFSFINDGPNPDAYFAVDNISLTYGGYCTAWGSVAGFEKISNVTLTGAGINNNSTSNAGYENFTAIAGNVTAGQTYAFSASAATTFADDQVFVWIDCNQDGDFDDAGELVFTSAAQVSPWAGNISIPLTANAGTTKMRVRLHDSVNGGNSTPCGGSFYGQVEDYTLNIAAPPACSGVPNPGNTLTTQNNVCSSTSFTLSLQNNPGVSGLTYQWQSAADFAFTTPVNLGTAITQSITQVVATYYRCIVTCAGNNGISNPVLVNMGSGCQCGAYPNSNFSSAFFEYVSNVNFAGINNSSGGNPGGPVNYLNQSASVQQGNNYNLSATIFPADNDYVYTWIDWNQNGSFLDAGEQYTLAAGTFFAGPHTLNITVPLTAVLGSTRMRVMVIYDNALPNPSINYNYGEAEDYCVTVTGTALPPTISGLSATEVCTGSSLIISGSNLSGASSITIGGTPVASIASNTGSAITVIVGAGTTGIVSVTTPGGTANSAATVTVKATPATPAGPTSPPVCPPGPNFTINWSGTPPVGENWYWQVTASGTSTANNANPYIVSAPDVYYLRSYNGTCWSNASAAISVDFAKVPVVSAEPDPKIICSSNTTQLSASVLNENITGYNFTAVAGTYAQLSGGTDVDEIENDEAVSGAIPIGFNFNYAGAYYNEVFASSNGFLSFNSNVSSSLTNDLANAAANISPVLAALWDNMDGIDGTASYITSGAAPNRIFTFEWRNWYWDWFTASSGIPVISFQVKLYESNGVIEFVYRTESGTLNTADGASIGITSAATGSFISLNNASAAPIASTVTSTNNIAAKPVNGQVYRFTPPAFGYTYSWTPAAGLSNTSIANPVATVSGVPGNYSYTVTVTNTDGCTASDIATVAITGALNGLYSVGALNIGGEQGHFNTLSEAVEVYNANCGLTGPVIFALTDALYSGNESFPIQINTNINASAVNTLTIKPHTAVNASITGNNSKALIQLNGADYIIIDGSNNGTNSQNLSFNNTNISGTGSIVWLNSVNATNGATNNVVKNSIFSGATATGLNCGIISSGKVWGSVAEAQNSNNLYQGNNFNTMLTAIAVVGPTGNETGTKIIKNNIGSTIVANKLGLSGIELYQQQAALVAQNNIAGIISSSSVFSPVSGIAIFGTSSVNSIKNNSISNISMNGLYGACGILLQSSTTTAGDSVINNFISGIYTSGFNGFTANDNGNGIVINFGGAYKIWNNTVRLNTNQTNTTGNPAALLITSTVPLPNSLSVMNNIFVNEQTQSGPRYAIICRVANTVFSNAAAFNYNDFYTTGTNLGYLNGANRNNLAALQAGFAGSNVNAVNIQPNFISATDLHLDPANNTTLDDLGIPITNIYTDIDADIRNTIMPDMGADEFSTCSATTVTWLGKADTDWSNGLNWCSGAAPTSAQNVILPQGTPNDPVIFNTINGFSNNIDLKGTAISLTINNGGSLDTKGNFNNGGTFTNDGTLILTGTGTQNFPGNTGTVAEMNNLTINKSNAATASLNNDISIRGELKLTQGILGLNNNDITLRSTLASTAFVSALGTNAAITYGTGRFKVERFIQYIKNWNLLASPTAEAQTINASWQNSGTYVPNYFTNISGPSGTGLDFVSPFYSMKWYSNGASQDAYINVANTTSTVADSLINRFTGYYLFVRGDRSIGLGGTGSPVTLSSRGKLFTGDLFIAATGTGTQLNPTTAYPSLTAGRFISVANPYASAIDPTQIIKINLKDAYTIWDPTMTGNYGLGGYISFNQTGGWLPTPAPTMGSPYPTTTYKAIQSGQAFLMEASGGIPAVAFNESQKNNSTLITATRLQDNATDLVMMSAMLQTNDGTVLDGNRVVFNEIYDNAVGNEDATKLMNVTENFGVIVAVKNIIIEGRKPVAAGDTIFYHVNNLRNQAYTLSFTAQNMDVLNVTAELIDNFLQTRTAVSLTGNTGYNFYVTNNLASRAPNRFMLVFKPGVNTVPVTFIELSAVRNSSGSIKVNWKVANETNIDFYDVERSRDGINFSSILQSAANNSSIYSKIDLQPLSADNYYRVKAVEQNAVFLYSKVVKVAAEKVFITISPNPVKDKRLSIQYSGFTFGKYLLAIESAEGKRILEEKFEIQNTNGFKKIHLKKPTAAGIYFIKIKDEAAKTLVTERVIIE